MKYVVGISSFILTYFLILQYCPNIDFGFKSALLGAAWNFSIYIYKKHKQKRK